jgi:small subunit ribosomal protein S7
MSRKESFADKARTGFDPVYNNGHLFKLVNRVMLGGEKSTAEKIVYEALKIVSKETGLNALDVFLNGLENVRPIVEVRSRRIGGATYQIPVDVRSSRSYSLGLKWIVAGARKRKDTTMISRLANELIDAKNMTGNAMKKKEEVLKMVEGSKAFSHMKF